MPSNLLNILPLAAGGWSVSPQWAFRPWLVVLMALACGALVVYLYRAQRQVAPRGTVAVLTALRVLLVILAFVLLAGLSVRWNRTGSSGGTLWVVLDGSGSMALADPQSAPAEKLRWAHALGYLPPDRHPGPLDRAAAELAALRSELNYLRSVGELATDGRDAPREVEEYAGALRSWGDSVRALADDVAKESTGAEVAESLRSAATRINSAADAVAGKQRREEAAKQVPWAEISSGIEPALAQLRKLADDSNEQFLARHGSDAKVKEALDKVGKLTRAGLAQEVLAKGKDAGFADALARQETKLLTFADAPHPVALEDAKQLGAALLKSAGAPAGQSTNLAAPLRHVADHLSQDEPAAVVVVSDGRHNNGGDLVEPARRLAARGVRVFTLALGSSRVAPDAAVEQLDAPDWIYKDDTLRAQALLRLDGLAGKPVTVEFYRGDAKIETKTVTPAGERATQVVSFSDRPPQAGVFEYDVRVADLPDEAVKENNRLGARVAVKQDKLAVLVIEDMPRWEYRHLVAYLSRDNRVKLQTVLLQPARVEDVQRPAPLRASPTNDGTEAQLLPQGPAGWAAFDLVVLGDVPKESLGEQDQQHLAAAVRDRGTTLLLIAGPFNMPHRLAGTPLADLVPVELSAEWPADALADHVKNGFKPAVAPEGAASILGQFTIDEEANAATWGALPPWYWHSPQTQAKRSAGVVWSIAERNGAPASAPAADAGALDAVRQRALLSTMSVGMGRVMYLASDSTWRMRQVNGQNPHERFWGQVIRWVVASELPAGGKLVRFGTDKPRYVAGDPVVVTARLLGEDFAPLKGQKLKVVAKSAGKDVAEAELAELPDAPGYYRATLGGVPAGRVELALAGDAAEKLMARDPAAAQKTLAVDVQSHLSVEQRNVNADRAALARLAEAGGGAALDAAHAGVLAEHLPKLNYATETVEEVGLFTDPEHPNTRLSHWVFLGVFATVASAEWIIRKAAGLV